MATADSAYKIEDDIFITPADLVPIFGIKAQSLYSKILKEFQIDQSAIKTNTRYKIFPKDAKRFLTKQGITISPQVITTHVVKGGVGKTTLTHGLASRASALGFKTLMIDLDQQANLTSSFDVYTIPKEDPTLVEVLSGHFKNKKIGIQDLVRPLTEFLHIIPANLNVANLDIQLIQGTENIGTFFADLLVPIRKDYDLIFLDCPPSLSRVSVAAQCFADHILLPVNLDRFSLDGLELTLDHLTATQKKFKSSSELHIVINKLDRRQTIMSNAIVSALVNKYKDFLMETYVSASRQIENSIAQNRCIWSARTPKNQALEDMHHLLIELLDLKKDRK